MLWTLLGLFLSAFGAATLLPLQSEAVLLGLLYEGSYAPIWLISIASLGNILGSCVNWYLGLKIEHYKDKKWFRLQKITRICHFDLPPFPGYGTTNTLESAPVCAGIFEVKNKLNPVD